VTVLLRPRWIALHLLVAGLAFGCVYAAIWQWDVATAHHDMRNYAYAVQWWIFLACGLWFWVKVMRDGLAKAAQAAGGIPMDDVMPATYGRPPGSITSPPTYLGYTMPQASAITVDDPELARYNEYLSALARSDSEAGVRTEGRT
jgi:hypothetical protein